MTGISRFEKVILLITAAFILLTVGLFFSRQGEAAAYQVITWKEESVPVLNMGTEEGKWPDSLLDGERINLNTAKQKDLERLPGIGEKQAGAMIAYREKFGSFQSVEELERVSGIGEATMNKVRPYVSVGP